MSYEKTIWIADETPLSPANMNKIEQGIKDAHDIIESGTWTPIIKGATVAGTHTYLTQIGNYIRVGKLVKVSGRVRINVKDVNMAGGISIAGLPFACKSGSYNGVSIGAASLVDLSAGYTFVTGVLLNSQSEIPLYQCGDNIAYVQLQAAAISNSTDIVFSVAYETN